MDKIGKTYVFALLFDIIKDVLFLFSNLNLNYYGR